MKSTKNVLMTGVVLAIALFASVQVAAMEKMDKEGLEYYQELLEKDIKTNETIMREMTSKKNFNPELVEAYRTANQRTREELSRVKEQLYSNRSFK
ncbi:MAG TPA: hypothetical protein VHX42_02195 [Candidatus Babeliales bacterium]|jgi:hypothetical protein|nr:hypothetical protein [Candidatus Babeliales bacterium]